MTVKKKDFSSGIDRMLKISPEKDDREILEKEIKIEAKTHPRKPLIKLPFNIYIEDMEKLEEIKDVLTSKGIYNCTNTMALRIALRSYSKSERKVMSLYKDILSEDGRKTRHK